MYIDFVADDRTIDKKKSVNTMYLTFVPKENNEVEETLQRCEYQI
jgi:hypothetical protein